MFPFLTRGPSARAGYLFYLLQRVPILVPLFPEVGFLDACPGCSAFASTSMVVVGAAGLIFAVPPVAFGALDAVGVLWAGAGVGGGGVLAVALCSGHGTTLHLQSLGLELGEG